MTPVQLLIELLTTHNLGELSRMQREIGQKAFERCQRPNDREREVWEDASAYVMQGEAVPTSDYYNCVDNKALHDIAVEVMSQALRLRRR